eukprot:8553653-Pyramimonas_sp.AAC.1
MTWPRHPFLRFAGFPVHPEHSRPQQAGAYSIVRAHLVTATSGLEDMCERHDDDDIDDVDADADDADYDAVDDGDGGEDDDDEDDNGDNDGDDGVVDVGV